MMVEPASTCGTQTMTQTDALVNNEEGVAPDKQPPRGGQLAGGEESAPMVSMGVSAIDGEWLNVGA